MLYMPKIDQLLNDICALDSSLIKALIEVIDADLYTVSQVLDQNVNILRTARTADSRNEQYITAVIDTQHEFWTKVLLDTQHTPIKDLGCADALYRLNLLFNLFTKATLSYLLDETPQIAELRELYTWAWAYGRTTARVHELQESQR